MSSNTLSTFFLIAALLYATANPLAHATFFNFFNPTTTVIVNGRVCCTVPGGACIAATTPGIAGATATLNCPPLGVVATTTTDGSGNFAFNVGNLPQTIVPTACTVSILLPLTAGAATSCTLLTGAGITGTLTSPVAGSFTNSGGFLSFFLPNFNGRVFIGSIAGFARVGGGI